MLPEAFRHVKRCFADALGDVECLTASYLPGNQVDGLPGIVVRKLFEVSKWPRAERLSMILGRKFENLMMF